MWRRRYLDSIRKDISSGIVKLSLQTHVVDLIRLPALTYLPLSKYGGFNQSALSLCLKLNYGTTLNFQSIECHQCTVAHILIHKNMKLGWRFFLILGFFSFSKWKRFASLAVALSISKTKSFKYMLAGKIGRTAVRDTGAFQIFFMCSYTIMRCFLSTLFNSQKW